LFKQTTANCIIALGLKSGGKSSRLKEAYRKGTPVALTEFIENGDDIICFFLLLLLLFREQKILVSTDSFKLTDFILDKLFQKLPKQKNKTKQRQDMLSKPAVS